MRRVRADAVRDETSPLVLMTWGEFWTLIGGAGIALMTMPLRAAMNT